MLPLVHKNLQTTLRARYAQKHDEEFEPYFNKFAPLLCQMASKASTKPKHDLLAISAIKFLAAVVVKTSHRTVFAKIIDQVNKSDPKVIGFDIFFTEKDKQSPANLKETGDFG